MRAPVRAASSWWPETKSRFDDVLDLQAPFFGGVYINIDVALRVDHGRDSLRTHQVGSVGQTSQEKLLD